jgi:hypothetical protein
MGCSDTYCFEETVGLQHHEPSVSVYPNPLRGGILTIESSAFVEFRGLTDMLGNALPVSSLNRQGYRVMIGLEHLTPGIYVLQLINGNRPMSIQIAVAP